MAITKNGGRQYPLVAKVDFTYAEIGADAAVADLVSSAIDIPGNAIITGGSIVVETAFNNGTSAVADVGDGVTANRYLNNVDLTTVARTPLVPTGYTYLTPDSIDLNLTSVGAAATAGAGYLEVEYILDGRANEVQPV